MNKIDLMGRIVETPTIKTTLSGKSVTSFTVAIRRDYGGQQAETDFIPVVAWNNTAEFVCKYFEKGKMIAVSGSLQTTKYEDRQGNKRTAYEVVARDVYFCGDKSENKADTKPISKPEEIEEIDDSEDLPF